MAAKKDASPSPAASASASAAPLPTATPESPDVAIPRLEAKIKENPSDKDSLQELAGYYLAVGKPDQALGLTQRLLTLGAKTAQVYYLDGIAYQTLGHVKEATGDFEQATTIEPTNAQILLTLTNLYLQSGRGADAERIAKRATTFNPSDKRVFENYGLVLGQEGKFDEARTQFEMAAKIDPKDPQPVVLEARSYVSQKAFALAAQDFDRALTIDPKDPDALLGKATLQANGHQVKESIATFEQLLAAEPTDDAKAAVLVQEYTVYRDEKMNDEALATLKRAESTYPNVAAVHIAFGDYDVAIAKDTNAGIAEWKTALGPKQDNADALGRLAQYSLSQNKSQDAIGYLKRLTQATPDDPRGWLTLGQVQAQSRQYTDARASFQTAFQIQHTPQALAGLGSVDLELRNYRECQQVFAAIDRGAPDVFKTQPQLLYVYGKCAQGNGDKPAAMTAYTRFKPYVKPGSQLDRELQVAIASVSAKKPSPKKTAAPKKKTAAQ
jgi:tetratricopeptide (TPR) repeat protein